MTCAAPRLDLLDRKLLFVTGKGGVGKTTIAAALALLGVAAGQAHPGRARSTPRATWPTSSRRGPLAFKPREVAPGLCGHGDGHRGVAQGVPEPPAEASRCSASIGPLARTLRLRGQRRARGEGDPHHRQAPVGGARAALRPRRGRRRRPPATSSASSPRRRPSTSSCRSGLVRDQTRWMLDILADPASTGAVIVAAPEEMPVNETIELVDRLARRDRRRPGRGRRQPGAARAVRPRRGRGLRPSARAATHRRGARRRPPGRRRSRPCSTRPQLAVTLRRTRGRAPRRACASELPDELPLLYVPVPVHPHATACGPRARSPRRSARGAGVLMAAARRPAATAGRTRAAARGQGDRDLLRLGRRRQDHHRGRRWPRWPRSTSAARCSCSPSTRPSAWPTPSASSTSATSRPACPPRPFAAAGVEPRGELWAAMLDTKQSWDDLVRRHAPDARPATRSSPTRSTRTSPAVRAEPRLHRHGAALRDPRVGPLRPDHRRHAAHPQRHRLPRGARAHGRLLLQPPAALAHRRRTESRLVNFGVEALLPRRRPHPRLAVPRGHRRVLPPLPDDVRRASSSGPRRSTRMLPTGAPPSSWCPRSRRRRSTRPSSSSTRSTDRKLHLGALVLNKVLPAYLLDRRATGAAAAPATPRPTTIGRRAGRRDVGARRPGRPGAARGGRELPQLPGGRQARGRAARRAGRRARRAWPRPVLRRRHPRPGRLLRLGEQPLALSAPVGHGRQPIRPDCVGPWPPSPTWSGRPHGARRRGCGHLQRLVAEWGLLADLCFADLLLFVPTVDAPLVVLGQVRPSPARPSTAPTGRHVGERQRAPAAEPGGRSGEIIEGEITGRGAQGAGAHARASRCAAGRTVARAHPGVGPLASAASRASSSAPTSASSTASPG